MISILGSKEQLREEMIVLTFNKLGAKTIPYVFKNKFLVHLEILMVDTAKQSWNNIPDEPVQKQRKL